MVVLFGARRRGWWLAVTACVCCMANKKVQTIILQNMFIKSSFMGMGYFQNQNEIFPKSEWRTAGEMSQLILNQKAALHSAAVQTNIQFNEEASRSRNPD